MSSAGPATTVVWLALAIGMVFGAVAGRTRFCTMGAVADIVNLGDWGRMRMWLLAIAVAILGTATLDAAGFIDVDRSIYRGTSLNWLSHLTGGLCFGFGMVLASGCAARTLGRIGAGSVKALVVFLVLGLVAYMTMRGVLAVFRVNVLDTVALHLPGGQGLPELIASIGLTPQPALCAWFVGCGLLAIVVLIRPRLASDQFLGGAAVGALVVSGWYVSGYLGYVAEDPETLQEAFLATNSGRMESLTFVAPQAYTLELLLLWSDSTRRVTFAIASTLGVVVGSLGQALLAGSFRWEGFRDLEDTTNHLVGAVLMGFGGVVAMGCTIGQGITGVSTLAAGSFLSLFAIIAGARLAIGYQYWRAEHGG
ncbi:MAG TPA: YeeE/YedE family protein [Candidatus Accumulibacter phosphatis]|nr:MAG: putative inner membrane protein [Candidatus Accumulibacter sp. SK-11]HAY28645.1 YeeE/YedE family protein [Accumulibacter sp.]HRL76006.1 YeeE/YedE family protein [Candidatus Accumulibacter phosphatis]HCN67038.1 YeeE/YedE family protein [Accumulibacter sp.]HCV12317.1 YeeE/YedE family protein [Accumulibacter sp.]